MLCPHFFIVAGCVKDQTIEPSKRPQRCNLRHSYRINLNNDTESSERVSGCLSGHISGHICGGLSGSFLGTILTVFLAVSLVIFPGTILAVFLAAFPANSRAIYPGGTHSWSPGCKR
jgi:hypothetical protein